MSVYVCGDTHFDIDIRKLTTKNWSEQKTLTKDDYLIVLGDFGLIWSLQSNRQENYLAKQYTDRKFTTLFIDGNHENFNRINELPEVDMFGSKVGKYVDGIYHLKRGNVYTIEDKKIFCMGGGLSIDKVYRTPGISWWEQEMHNKEEQDNAIDNLDINGWSIDYVLTHAAPTSIVDVLGMTYKIDDPVSKFFEFLLTNGIQFKQWHFGHYHVDTVEQDRFFCHYNNEPFQII